MEFVIDIILIAVFIFTVFFAYRKGFIKSLCDIFGILVSGVAAAKISGMVDDWIYDNIFKNSIISSIEERLAASAPGETAIQIKEAIIGIPEFFNKLAAEMGFDTTGLSQNLSEFDLSAENAAELLAQTAVQPIMTVIIRCVVFLVLALVFIVLLGFLSKAMTKAIDKTALNTMNKVLGALLGVLKGAVLVVLLTIAIILLAALLNNETLNGMIEASRIIEFLNTKSDFFTLI